MEFDSDTDIVKKYQKYPEFRKDMDDIQSFYDSRLNMAIYENLDKWRDMRIFDIVECQHKDKYLIFYYGHRYKGTDSKDLEKLYNLYISTLDELLREKFKRYSIVFFNGLCTSNDSFSAFKSMYKTLPLVYYSKLDKIYVVSPSLSVKSLDWIVFGRLNKMFSKRLEYINRLEELPSFKMKKKMNELLPPELVSLSPVNETIEMTKSQPPPVTVNKAVSPFNFLIVPLEKYEMSDEGVPRLLKLLLLKFYDNPKFLEMEGIFRKSGSIEDEQVLVTELFYKNHKYLDSVDDGYVVSGVIKKIFTSLTEPIFPFTAYDKIIKANNIQADNQLDFVKSLLKELPELNFRVIMFMTTFIVDQVIKRESHNKMSCYNCAVVFAPCFLRPKSYELTDLMYSGKLVKILLVMFSKFQEVFGKTAHRMAVFRRSAEKTFKEELQEKRSSTESPQRKSKDDGRKSGDRGYPRQSTST